MHFYNFKEIEAVEVLPNISRKIVHLNNVMLLYLEMGPNTTFPLGQHPQEQIGYIVRGKAEVTIGPKKRIIQSGEGYLVPSNVAHQVMAVGDEPLHIIDVFSPIREDLLIK